MQKAALLENLGMFRSCKTQQNVETPGLGRSPRKQFTDEEGLKARSIKRF
jgi:hypothetical protein